MKLIWAYDDEVPRSPTDIKKHASIHRSSRSAFLTLTPLTQTQWEEQRRRENSSIQTLEFRTTDVPVPNDIRTTYWCQCFALPPRREKLHLIRVSSVNIEQYTLHMSGFIAVRAGYSKRE